MQSVGCQLYESIEVARDLVAPDDQELDDKFVDILDFIWSKRLSEEDRDVLDSRMIVIIEHGDHEDDRDDQ